MPPISQITSQLLGPCACIYNCDTTPFRDNRIPLFVKAVKLNMPLQSKLHFVIDDALLEASMLPHSVASFDNTRHLCEGDVIFSDQYAVIIIK